MATFSSYAQTFWEVEPSPDGARRLLESMTDEEIVAQVFLLGWEGEAPSAEIQRWLTERNIGGVKVFGWNANNLYTLGSAIGRMQRISQRTRTEIPLFTATDQEGGWVRHVKGAPALATSLTPGNMAIGATGLPYDAYHTARFIAEELRAVGVNMNFAPTVDVYVNPEAHVIGPRAFSADAELTGLLGLAYYHGMEDARVIATAKHFPGHGNAAGDSHGVLPVIQDSMDLLWDRELLPYRYLIPEGLPAVLSGHLSFPSAAGDDIPASISPFFTRELLRDRLGFDGIVITDDLYMAGVWVYGNQFDWGISEIVIAALEAGNDMVMLSRTPAVNGYLWNQVLSRYREDGTFRTTINEAVHRLLTIKLRYLYHDDRVPLVPDMQDLPSQIRVEEGAAFFRDQAARSVTIVSGASIPYSSQPGERVLIAGKYGYFLQEAQRVFPSADVFRFRDTLFDWSSEHDRARFSAIANDYDTIVYCLSDPNTLEVLQTIEAEHPKVIVISVLSPIYLRETPWVDTAIAVYGWGIESYRAGFSVLLGTMGAGGTLPIHPSPTTIDGTAE